MRIISAILLLILAVPAARADDKPAAGEPDRPDLPTVALMELLDAVAKNSKKTFLVQRRVRSDIVIGNTNLRDVDYGDFLTILYDNDLASVRVGENYNIIPIGGVRQHALPFITDVDADFEDDEWVTLSIVVQNQNAAQMVPILRPLLPQAGHLAAFPGSRTLLIVDRFANTKRIEAIVRDLDSRPAVRHDE